MKDLAVKSRGLSHAIQLARKDEQKRIAQLMQRIENHIYSRPASKSSFASRDADISDMWYILKYCLRDGRDAEQEFKLFLAEKGINE